MKCPYCGADADCDEVDVGVGMIQCGPYYCEACRAYELHRDEPRKTDDERRTGWRKEADDNG